jgi:hypothetical protein
MTDAHGLEPVTLIRDCPATIVPHGERVSLDAGGVVAIVQQLGGSITVRTEMGMLLRIDAQDAGALGLARTGEHLSVGENEPFDIDRSSMRCAPSTTPRSRSRSSTSASSTGVTSCSYPTAHDASRSTCP